jgi:hypothetical protein
MYDQMVCWCETNEKEKTKAIDDADMRTTDLQSEIEQRSAQFGEGGTEIAQLKEEIASSKASLKTATSIREKEAAEFSEDEKSAMQAVTNLKNAIDVLSKHQGGSSSLVQLESPVLASVKAVLRDVTLKYELMQGDIAKMAEHSTAGSTAFLAVTKGGTDLANKLRGELGAGRSSIPVSLAEHALARAAEAALPKSAATGAFVQAPSYSSQSNSIFGILNQMRDEFEADLSQKQKDEMKAASDFKDLAASKAVQIEAAQKKLDTMEGDAADNQKALSDAKEDHTATREQRTSDVEFLSSLRLTCQGLDKQWAERSHTRSAEITAVAEALSVLQEDDNREHLAKTVTLLQLHSDGTADATAKQRRSRAAAVLRAAATLRRSSASPDDSDDLLAAWKGMRAADAGGAHAQLSNLAVSVELDSFTEVKKAMDKMMADLKDQQQAEVAQKAYCGQELNQNDKDIYAKGQEKKDLESKMESLAANLKALQGDVADANVQIADTKLAMKKGSQARETENAEFQTVIADQRATQEILQKALSRLAAFYKKNLGAEQLAGFVQQKQTPPVQFNKYKKNSGSNSVMGLLEQVIEDSKALEGEALAGEQSAQAAYEAFVKSSNKVIADLETSVVSKSKSIAETQLEASSTSSDHGSVVGELESLAAYTGDLHTQCDFVLKNFAIRQKARLQEIEAIQQGKAILSGMA